ncbi:MAG: glycosyltransferase family 2 protein [bacterium]|nr:glycosyltransferase family 2 protein [bacterium]
MTSVPKYDVVIVTHNHASVFGACLQAVSALTPPPTRLIVVDNASSDESAEIAASQGENLPLDLIHSAVNEGFAAGANRGIAECSSEWILLLNPDCAVNKEFVHRLLRTINEGPDAEIVGAATGLLMRAIDEGLQPGSTIDSAGMVMTPGGRHLDRGAGSALGTNYKRAAWVFGGTGAATLYRRTALEDIAYPDGQIFAESFFAYREDAELAWRLQWRGWRCLYQPLALASHLRGFRPEQGRRGHSVINLHSVKNRFLMRAHCADLKWLVSRLGWWLLRDLLVIGACLTVERSSRPALSEAWRWRHDALARRRHVLATARTSSQQMRRWFRTGEWVEEI